MAVKMRQSFAGYYFRPRLTGELGKLEEAGKISLPLNIQRECGLELGLRAPGCGGINLCRLNATLVALYHNPHPPQEVSEAPRASRVPSRRARHVSSHPAHDPWRGRGWGFVLKREEQVSELGLRSMGPRFPCWVAGV